MKKYFVLFIMLFVVSFIFINCSEDEVTNPDNGDSDPTVNITSPADGESFTVGANITFTGSGVDHEGTDLHEDSLIWTSNHDDIMGTGTSKEVKLYYPDAWMDRSKDKIGYEINFTQYFYEYEPPRPLEEIEAEILKVTEEILELEKEDL